MGGRVWCEIKTWGVSPKIWGGCDRSQGTPKWPGGLETDIRCQEGKKLETGRNLGGLCWKVSWGDLEVGRGTWKWGDPKIAWVATMMLGGGGQGAVKPPGGVQA